MTAISTIRINFDALPEEFDRGSPDIAIQVIEMALHAQGIPAVTLDAISHIKIELPTSRLTTALPILADLKLI